MGNQRLSNIIILLRKTESSAPEKLSNRTTRLNELQVYIPLILLGIMMVIGSLLSPVFLTSKNLLNILWAVSVLGIITMGQTVLLITGNFDLSVARTVGLVGILTVLSQISGIGLFSSIIIGFLGGLIFGVLNGLIVNKTKASPFLVTLGVGQLAYSISLVLTKSRPFYPTIPSFSDLGRGTLFGSIPYSVFIFIVLAVSIEFVLKRTVLGRSIYMIGLNQVASRLSGVRVSIIRLGAFVICGLTAALAGLILVSRNQITGTNAGVGMEFDSLIAAVLGGTSLFGGTGGALRSVVGVCALGVINNIFVLMNVTYEGQQIVKGTIFLILVLIDVKLRRRK